MTKIMITPETKVGALLEAYPEAEAALIDALRAKGHEVVALADEGGSWKVWVRRAG